MPNYGVDPSGTFEMGNNEGREFSQPALKVYLDDIHIDLKKVTNGQYSAYVDVRADYGG
jgi:formylglycine-generating enzyme required for sulfatase activity